MVKLQVSQHQGIHIQVLSVITIKRIVLLFNSNLSHFSAELAQQRSRTEHHQAWRVFFFDSPCHVSIPLFGFYEVLFLLT